MHNNVISLPTVACLPLPNLFSISLSVFSYFKYDSSVFSSRNSNHRFHSAKLQLKLEYFQKTRKGFSSFFHFFSFLLCVIFTNMWSSRHSSDVQRQGKAPEASNFAHTCNRLSQYMKEKGSLRDLNLEIGGKVESVEALVKPGSFLVASPSTSKNLQTNSGKSAQPSSEKQCSVLTVEDASYKASTSFSKEATTRESKTAQLTIFYSGRVLIFDDFPADKVKELVSVAKKGSSQMSYGITLNTIQEKLNTVASTSSAREGLPPRPHAAGGKQHVGISSKDKMSAANSGSGASTSEVPDPLSPQSEANESDLPIARRSSLHRFLEKRRDRAAVRGPYHRPEPSSPSSKDDQQLDLNLLPQKD